MTDRIRGLTLWRPWAWAIAHAGKRIENREWRPPRALIGTYLAIHAGKTLDKATMAALAAAGVGSVPSDGGPEGIVAVARLAYCFDGDVHALEKLLGEQEASLQIERWLDGESFGWVLQDVVALRDPIPCRGAQGLWPVPGDVLQQLRCSWKEARHA